VVASLLGSAGREEGEGNAGVTASAAEWLRAWDSQGFHRTGTEGDEAGAAWLAEEAGRLGAVVTTEAFTLRRVDPVAAYLEVDGVRIEGVPVFDAPPTGPDGISGVLGEDIAVADLSPHAVYTGEYQRLRRDSAHRAFVIVCKGANPGMGLLNAEQFRDPYGVPAIHVAQPVQLGSSARAVVHYERTVASACNVVVALQGTDRSRSPVVVMTPRSSWWQSTAERGGGIVCWLECLGALLAAPPACDVMLTANSGHELGHLGLDDFVARRHGWEREALWLHWGANIGAADGALSIMSAGDEMRSLASRELAQMPHSLAPKAQVPSGETRDIHRAGGRYLTFVGSNRLFHLPQDRWPHAVDVPVVEHIASAAARVAVQLTR
jgi:hypothetical protein